MDANASQFDKIRKIARSYYARRDIQEILAKQAKNREFIPRYIESFGKRPDTLEYPGDVWSYVERGATSFHMSEEIWRDPMELGINLSPEQMNKLRVGWDLIIDIDCKFLEFSKVAAFLITEALFFHGVRNVGLKFSVSGDTPILIKFDNTIKLLPIKGVIDLFKSGKKIQVLSINKKMNLCFANIYNYLKHKDWVYRIYHKQSNVPLKVTGHHSVFSWNKGEILEKKVLDLKKGDWLVTYNSSKKIKRKLPKFLINNFNLDVNQYIKKTFKSKVKITKELMRLMGYFLAEGHLTKIINQTGFSFNANELSYVQDCKKLLKRIIKRKISVRNPSINAVQLTIHSKEWYHFFENFCGKGAHNKHVPDFMWNLPKDYFLELLVGYFRGDGTIHRSSLEVKSVSKRLITELVWLCKLHGISCNLSFDYTKPHKMPQGIVFKGGPIFMLTIPLTELPIKEFNKKKIDSTPMPFDKVFPIDGLKEVYYQIKPKMFNLHRNEQMTLKKKSANLNRIKKVIIWFKDYKSVEFSKKSLNILKNYERLFGADLGILEIKKVDKYKLEEVYDISVDETEAFFGNYYPILLHNSGGSGFHIGLSHEAFPNVINGLNVKEFFPQGPRIIAAYLREMIERPLRDHILELSDPKDIAIAAGKPEKLLFKDALQRDFNPFSILEIDTVLISPRHLLRSAYSLHERTGLASIVIKPEQLKSFHPGWAKPERVLPMLFLKKADPDEGRELLMQAMDWNSRKEAKARMEKTISQRLERTSEIETIQTRGRDYGKIVQVNEENFPPCIKQMLQGMKQDGRKRALFILINFLRSINLTFEEVEKRLMEWNSKNYKPLRDGYIKTQLNWFKKQDPRLPPNCSLQAYYQDVGVCIPDGLCKKIKNPVNYAIVKARMALGMKKEKSPREKVKKTSVKKKAEKI